MKYDFTEYVTKDSVMTLTGTTKLEVMDQLIQRAADLTKLSRDHIFRLVWKREQMMTTGVGNMLALPHIRINDILHPYVLIGVCENPIEDYQGQDDLPVRVIVLTVAPDEDQEAYLQLLGDALEKAHLLLSDTGFYCREIVRLLNCIEIRNSIWSVPLGKERVRIIT